MRLVSFTLAGPGTAPIIGDALRSVAPIVDDVIVIWTGGESDRADDVWEASLGTVRRTGRASTRPGRLWHNWPWINDYGAARNAGLDIAASVSDGWACMIDTDERVICPDPAALCAWLAALPDAIAVVLVHHHDGTHTRERLFRLPSRYRFQGRTHETYPCPEDEQAIAPRELIRWSELPKTREQLRAKFQRDVEMLTLEVAENEGNGAAWYYLGTSMQSLALHAREDGDEAQARDRFEDAINCFRTHRSIDTSGAPAWHEGTAFSCYRASECYLALSEYDRAIDCAVAGLVLDAGIAELYWIAGVASLAAGRPEQARAWCESAKQHGYGSASETRRRGFRVPHGLRGGPDEVIAAAKAMTGGAK